MAWARIDDQFFFNPKVLGCDKDAKLLYIASLCYASGQLTDGMIPETALPLLGIMAGVANAQASADVLLKAKLWQEVEGGFEINDYLEYNPSKEKVLSVREARKQAGSKGGQASLGKRKQDSPEANAQAIAQAKSKQNSSTNPSPTPYSVSKDTGAAPGPKKASRNLAPLFDAFDNAGAPRPLMDDAEAKAANTMLHNGVTATQLAECWQDVQLGRYGDGWLKANLSFVALLSHQRIKHYIEWVDAGRPPMASGPPNRNGQQAEAPRRKALEVPL